MQERPGLVVLFGSGETSRAGGQVFDAVARRLLLPLRVAVLETPAGFEVNSAEVASRVADFLRVRLQNEQPEITVIPARKRDTLFSPDDPEVTRPILGATMIFLGPGSPTYAVRQLRESLAWHRMIARHRLGAALVMASAATVAASSHSLPVYEIYKVGEDVHWRQGLDLFGPYGLSLVFIPHWNNAEGGASLDTSRCWMGQERFAQLLALLPPLQTIVGIDEHTALLMDFETEQCHVLGAGGVVLLRASREQQFTAGEDFAFTELGPFQRLAPASGIPPAIWQEAQSTQSTREATPLVTPEAVLALVEERQAARAQRNWRRADDLRERIAALGWRVSDTLEGPLLEPIAKV